jgi:NDP-mannose synthase
MALDARDGGDFGRRGPGPGGPGTAACPCATRRGLCFAAHGRITALKRAVILAGGLGTRLRPYTTVLPKPLMPVGDQPVLDLVVRQVRAAGFDRITIATGHLAELIEAFFGDGRRHGIPIDYHREHEPLGTVGSLALIDGLDEPFLVMNGDILTDLDYAALLARHVDSDAVATIATKHLDVKIPLGVMSLDHHTDPTRVTGYVEKPEISYVASMGIYCFDPAAIRHIEPGTRLDFPDLILRLIAAGAVVQAWRSEDYWLDIGRPEDYEQAIQEFEQMRCRLMPE